MPQVTHLGSSARYAAAAAILGLILHTTPMQAGQMFEKNGPPGSAFAELLAQLTHPDYETREEAERALRRLGPACVPELLQARSGARDEPLRYALDRLLLGPTIGEHSVWAWVDRLNDREAAVRAEAFAALEAAGDEALLQLPRLLEAHDLRTRYTGYWLIARLGARAQTLAPLLREEFARALEHPSGASGTSALRAAAVPVYLRAVASHRESQAWCDFFYASPDDKGFTSVDEMYDRLRMNHEGSETPALVRTTHPPRAEEGRSLLWGARQALEWLRQAEWETVAVAPELHLSLLAYALEAVGHDEASRTLLNRYYSQTAPAMYPGEDGTPN
ncbi:MAG: hypothetical protein HS116_14185 [Planctomycetes bacterium]|nr:hypothetical protein [Planctomycetota bacterium]